MHDVSRKRLWDEDIPPEIVIPGRSPGRRDPEIKDLVLKRVVDAKFALYSVKYSPDEATEETNGAATPAVVIDRP